VILYKCHLFGVSPPALVSSIGAGIGGQAAGPVLQQHSSAAWRANELLLQALAPETSASSLFRRQTGFGLSDCSLCSNVERKYQCVWCQNQCQHAHQCSAELTASTCPPPRIDSVSFNSPPSFPPAAAAASASAEPNRSATGTGASLAARHQSGQS